MPPAPSRAAATYRFRPTNGRVSGFLGIAAAVLVVVLAAVSEQNLTGVRVALGAALAGVLVWAVLLRPRVLADADTLVLRGAVRDTHVPLADVDEVTVRSTLNVWLGEQRFTSAAVGRSTRSMVRRRSSGHLSSTGLGYVPAGKETATVGDGDYATFVEATIRDLAASARRDATGPREVRRQWSVPVLAALGGLLGLFLVSLLLS